MFPHTEKSTVLVQDWWKRDWQQASGATASWPSDLDENENKTQKKAQFSLFGKQNRVFGNVFSGSYCNISQTCRSWRFLEIKALFTLGESLQSQSPAYRLAGRFVACFGHVVTCVGQIFNSIYCTFPFTDGLRFNVIVHRCNISRHAGTCCSLPIWTTLFNLFSQ